jgi:ABC-2 type transport system ATP-binding protein
VLSEKGVAFSEVSAHRATLEEAYMELTRDAVEYRASSPAGSPAGSSVPGAGL